MRAISPAWTNTPGATSWTGSGAGASPQKRAVRRERERGDEQSADEPTHGCQSEVLPAFLIVFAVCGGLWENLRRL